MPAGAPTEVVIVVYDGVQSLDVTGPLEVLTGANTHQARRGRPRPYTISTAGVGGAPVRTSSGLRLLPDRDLADLAAPGLLLVPGGLGPDSPGPELIGWLAEHGPAATRLVSVCTGAFLLAEAGLLTGRRATTHWAHSATLAQRHPEIDVDPDPIYVRDGHIATSAGVTAGIDLALALVEEDLGRDAAPAIARHLVVFLRRPGNQAQFSAQLRSQIAHRDPIRRIQQWITEHPEADLTVAALAGRAHLSQRQFARTFAAGTGTTCGRYVDQVRLEAARRRLEDTGDGVEEIARGCGYGTPETMRRAFVKALGVAPAEYRRRFRTTVTAEH